MGRAKWAAVIAVMASGCSGAGDVARPSGSNEARSGDMELCDAFEAWRAADPWPPYLTDLAPMSRDHLDEHLDARSARLHELAGTVAAAGIDLGLGPLADDFDATATAIRERWGTDGSEILGEALELDSEIEYIARPDRLTTPSAPEISRALSPRCDTAPADWTPVPERPTATSIPAHTIVAVSIDDPTQLIGFDETGETFVIESRTDVEVSFSQPDLEPHGAGNILINGAEVRDGVRTDHVFVAPASAPGQLLDLTPSDESWACGRWSESGDEIGVSRWRGASDFVAAAVDVATRDVREFPGVTDRHAFATTCPLVADDGIVVAIDHDLWRFDEHGSNGKVLATLPDCAVLEPRLRPGSDAVTFVTRCANVYDEGFYELVPGERPRRLLDGLLGAPSWSSDGEWIVFALFDGIEPNGVWLATPDGAEVAKISDAEVTWPLLLVTQD